MTYDRSFGNPYVVNVGNHQRGIIYRHIEKYEVVAIPMHFSLGYGGDTAGEHIYKHRIGESAILHPYLRRHGAVVVTWYLGIMP